MKFTFPKSERLKSRKLISRLFAEGKKQAAYPLLLFRLPIEDSNTPLKIAFAVPRKRIRQAAKRNRIKRLMREAWRLNKHLLAEKEKPSPQILLLLYTGKEENPTFRQMEKAVRKLLRGV